MRNKSPMVWLGVLAPVPHTVFALEVTVEFAAVPQHRRFPMKVAGFESDVHRYRAATSKDVQVLATVAAPESVWPLLRDEMRAQKPSPTMEEAFNTLADGFLKGAGATPERRTWMRWHGALTLEFEGRQPRVRGRVILRDRGLILIGASGPGAERFLGSLRPTADRRGRSSR